MLVSLTIKNVVLIESLTIEFCKGFCALTGETGAGKSILLDSLGLALGARSESGLVRKGAEQAQVIAEFAVSGSHPVHGVLREAEIAAVENEPVLLKRIVGADGRSRAFINDQPVSAGILRLAGDMLVEIHGQFDTHGLLDAKTHRALLDDYAAIDASVVSNAWKTWQAAERTLKAETEKMEQARRDEDYLRQAVEDLDGLSPEEGEEENLSSLRSRLMQREKILEGLSTSYHQIGEAEALLGTAWRALEKASPEETAPLREGLDRAGAELQEVLSSIQALSSDLEHSEYSLEEIDDRLFALRGQARKHHCTVDELPHIRNELAAQLDAIEQQDNILSDLIRQVEKARQDYVEKAKTVSVSRKEAAEKLDRLVAEELPPLKLDKAAFVTQLELLDEREWGAYGFDRVCFLVATNPGSAPGALNKIASGGEMARFMLALKVVMAEVGSAGTLVFDEVDSGIGGSTAAAVGQRLARLAGNSQILVVTHSPQVAARATSHWIVSKDHQDGVRTHIIPLQDLPERREEIARMLAGAEITEEARAAAQKLLEAA